MRNKLNFIFLSIPMILFFSTPGWTTSLKGDALHSQFDIKAKIINGKNLPSYLKDAQQTNEEEKYLLVTIINKSKKMAYFTLHITSPNNASVSLELNVDLLPPSNKATTPIYYLHYIGSPVMFVPEEQTQFEYEIKKLTFK